MQNVLIIPAAGSGKRFGGPQPKQFAKVEGIPVLVHTLRVFQNCPSIHAIIVGVSAQYQDKMRGLVKDHALDKVRDILIGGAERQDTVQAALDSQAAKQAEIVLVHDAVRPCCTEQLILRVIAAVQKFGAAVPGVPLSDTVKEITPDGFVERTPRRDLLRAVQTPQGFTASLLRQALEYVRSQQIHVTDDASAVEAFGHRVAVVDGDPENIKLTTQADRDRVTQYLARAAAQRSKH